MTPITMRLIPFHLLLILSVPLFGQKVEYRNDSLFLNNHFINAFTTKVTLDSILDTSGKTKKSKDSFRINPETGKKVKLITVFYYDDGLFFRKYDHDTTKMSIGIKLYREKNKRNDRKSELKEPFSGQLFIAGNYINDKRQLSQLSDLKNCSLEIHKVSFGQISSIIGGELVYQTNMIRLSFDSETDELTEVFIHYNFKRE